MRKFRIGVLVNEFNPEVGGAHNFVQAVVSALPFGSVDLAQIDLVLLVENNQTSLGSTLPISVYRSKWIEARLLDAYMFNASSKIVNILNKFNPLEKNLIRHKIDFLFFLGSSAIPTSIPFGVIVWDVQHRTHPLFPELQPGWTTRDELMNLILRRASIIVTGTNAGKKQLIEMYGVYDDNVYLIPHPVPPDVPELPARPRSDVFQFLYPAQFWPHKNHTIILESMRLLKNRDSLAFKVILVGSDKGNLPYIQELVNKYELSEHVEIRGFVPREELLSLYQESDALVYSSFSGPENLPPLEAFQSSLPVLYANFAGAREQLGEAALFFDPFDDVDLADKFLEIIRSQELRSNLISKGKAQLSGRSNLDFSKSLLQLFYRFSLLRRTWK